MILRFPLEKNPRGSKGVRYKVLCCKYINKIYLYVSYRTPLKSVIISLNVIFIEVKIKAALLNYLLYNKLFCCLQNNRVGSESNTFFQKNYVQKPYIQHAMQHLYLYISKIK